MLIPCSRSAHDQNVLARRPQWDQHGCHSTREKQASLEGSSLLAHGGPTRDRAFQGEESVLADSGRAGEKSSFLGILLSESCSMYGSRLGGWSTASGS